MSKKEKWNKLYDCPGFFYGKDPISLIQSHFRRLRKGKVLDLAMGEGRNSVFLAKHGFDVLGIDLSDVAVEKAKKLAYDENTKLETKAADVDMFVFPILGFDTILVSYFKPLSRFYNEILRSLAQGGTVLFENYTTDQLMRSPIKELENGDYYPPNELLKNLKDFQILYYNEGEENGKFIVQCIAKKPLDRDAVKYGFAKGDESETTGRFKAAEDLFKKKS